MLDCLTIISTTSWETDLDVTWTHMLKQIPPRILGIWEPETIRAGEGRLEIIFDFCSGCNTVHSEWTCKAEEIASGIQWCIRILCWVPRLVPCNHQIWDVPCIRQQQRMSPWKLARSLTLHVCMGSSVDVGRHMRFILKEMWRPEHIEAHASGVDTSWSMRFNKLMAFTSLWEWIRCVYIPCNQELLNIEDLGQMFRFDLNEAQVAQVPDAWVHHSGPVRRCSELSRGECALLIICRCRGCLQWPTQFIPSWHAMIQPVEKLALVSGATWAPCIFGICGVLIDIFLVAQFEGFSAWERIARAARKM